MKLSTRARYGLRSLLYLAEQDPTRAVPVREIAEQEGVSGDYLEHLLHAMKNSNLVKSVRGAGGGFMLGKPADQINLKDLFSALDEKIEAVWCIEEGEICPRSDTCKSRPIWEKLRKLLYKFASDTSLADAVGSADENRV